MILHNDYWLKGWKLFFFDTLSKYKYMYTHNIERLNGCMYK